MGSGGGGGGCSKLRNENERKYNKVLKKLRYPGMARWKSGL